jgi:hypothetical protein
MTTTAGAGGPAQYSTRLRGASWVDQLIDALARLPGPTWSAYVVLFAVLLAIIKAADWFDGGAPIGTLRPLDFAYAAWPVYFLGTVAYLREVASAAFSTFRPALEVSDDEADSIRHELVTMPQVPVTVVWLVFASVLVIGHAVDSRTAGIEGMGPVAWTTYTVVEAFAMGLLGVAVFRVLRHARSVARLHRQANRIDIYDRRPAHAFSRLTARGGILLMLPVLVSGIVAVSVTTANGLAAFGLGALLVIAATTGSFVLPLRGMHDRLVVAKSSRLAECELRVKATTDEIHRSVDEGARQDAYALNKTLVSLLQERDFLARMPTWPWEASTLRGFVTALVLPVLLWLVFRVLERLL